MLSSPMDTAARNVLKSSNSFNASSTGESSILPAKRSAVMPDPSSLHASLCIQYNIAWEHLQGWEALFQGR